MRLNPAALRAAAMLLAASASPSLAQTVVYTKANNANSLNLGTSWTNGLVPNANSILLWDSTVTAANTVTLGANLSVSGLRITNPGGLVTISGSVLTLGASGIDMSQATQNLTLSSGLVIGANQDWIVAGGRTITGPAGNSVSLTGTGNINFSRSSVAGFTTGIATIRFNSNGNGTGWGGSSGDRTANANVKVQSEGNGAAAWGTGTVILNGGQVAQINGNWTWSNNISITADSVIGNDSSNGLGRLLKLTGNLTSASGSTITFTNNITGGTRTQDVGFILAGASASTYGNTVISANSRVRVGGNAENTISGTGVGGANRGSLGTGTVTLSAATSELAFTRNDSHTVANAISGLGTLVIGGSTAGLSTTTNSQVVTFTGANTYSGGTTIAVGTLQVGAGGTAGTLGTGGVVNAGSLIFNRSDALSDGNAISGAGSVTKTGAGALTLSGNSSYTGGTTLVQGTIIATNGNALGTSGTVTINTAATGSTNTSILLGNVTMGRAITVANQGSGTVTLGSNGTVALPEFSGAITLNKAVTLDGSTNSDRLTFTGGIGGTGNVTIAGTGRVVFATTANTYSGTTTISAGSILQLSTGSATATSFIPDASLLTLGSGSMVKLAKGANSETIGGLAGTGTVRGHEGVASTASALTVSNAGDYSYGGVLEDGGASGSTLSLTKSGAGNQTLTGTSTYTGGTTISAGTLTLGHATDTLANTGAVTVSGGTLALGSNSDTIGALSLTSGAITGSGTLTTTGATFNSSSNLSIDVILAGGGLTKQGANTLTLTAANTYTGATTISAGTLSLASGASLDAASAVSVASGATLTGAGNAAGAVTVASGGILSPGASNVGTLSLGALTFDGAATIQLPISVGGTLDADINVNGNVVASGGAGSVTFALGANLSLLGTGTYSLVTYSGSQLADLNAFAFTGTTGARQDVSLDNASGAINLVVGNAFVIWSGDQGSGWSTASNWKLSSDNTAASYLENDVVVFNDAASSGTVDLSGNVTASTVTFSGDTLAYSVGSGNGSGFTAAALAKQGAATVTLNTANTITEAVTVSGGTLVLGDAGALGTATAQLTGGTLDLNGLAVANNIVLGGGTLAGDGATLSGVISETGGARALVVGSDLTLTGTNTYTGGTTINAGTLRVGAAGTSGDLGSGTVTNNGTLVFDRSDAVTVSNVIAGSGAFTKVGNNTLTLSGISSFGGTFAVDAGRVILTDNNSLTAAITVASGATLQVGNGATAGFIGNSATVSNAGTLEFSRTSDSNVATVISGAGAVSKIGTNTLSLNANNSISGEVTISAGTLRLGNGGTAGAIGSGNIVNNATLALNRSNTLTLGNLVSGTGALTQIGSGTSILTADNTYAGTTTITAGTLQVGNGGTTGSLGSGAVTNNAALVFNRSDSLAVGNAISGTGSLTKQGNGTLTLSVANTYSGGTTVSAGTLQLGSATAMGTGAVAVASGATLNVAGFGATNALTISGSGNGANPALWNSASAFTTLGAVTLGANASVGNSTSDKSTTLNLGATNLAGYTLTIAAGAVSINTRNFSSGDIVIANGGTLYTDNGTNTYSSVTGTITINAGGRMETRDTDNTAQTSSHAIVLNGGTLSRAVLANNNGGGAGTTLRNAISVDATNGGTITNNVGGFAINYRLTGALTGSGSLLLNGSQGVELQGDLSGYTGTATVTDGTLTFNPSANTTFGGTVAGSRPVVKSGANTLTFGSSQSYTGTTTVSGGTLALSGAGDISASSSVNLSAATSILNIASASGGRTVTNLTGAASSSVVLGSNALTVSSGAASTYSGGISGNGSLVKDGSGTLTLAGASTFSGGTTLNTGAIQVANATALGTGSVTLKAATTLTADTNLTLANAIVLDGNAILSGTGGANTQGLRLDGVVSGAFNLTKEGTGRVSLANNSNAFSGSVTVNAGILATGNGGLASASALVLSGGAIALGQPGTTTINNLSSASTSSYFTGNFSLLSGTGTARTLAINQTADGTYAGSFETSTGSRDVSVQKLGSATLTFTNTVNAYVGSTTVTAGTLAIGGAGRINSGAYAGAITVDSGATFGFDTSANQTLSGAITNAGTFRKSSSGTLTLSAASTASFGGAFAIDAGRVILTNNNAMAAAITVASGATLQVGNGATAGFIGNSATVSNAGTLEFNRTSDSNVGTVISGAGAISKLGSNILSLNADNSISGEVTISTGTLRIGGGGAAGSVGSGNIVNNATLALNRSDTLTLGNLVSGTGALTQIGSGTSVLTADNTYSGTTTISTGTLQVGDGGTTGSLGSGAVTNNAALVFNRSDALAVSNAISGTGSLTKQGAGTLTLDGTLSYTGATVVSAGTLVLGAQSSIASSSGYNINGTLDASALGTFAVASNQTLNGSGTIIGDVTVAGAHNPGNSPGVQTIDGDLTYASGATVQWELTTQTADDGQAGIAFDRIVVTGDVAFSGAVSLTLMFAGAGSDVDWTDAFWSSARSWLVYDVGGSAIAFGNLSLTDAVMTEDGRLAVNNVVDSSGTTTLASVHQDAGFFLGQRGNDIRLYYRPIPEPSTYGLILGGLALAGAAIRRRRAKRA